MNHRIKVGVLRGGPSSEHAISMETGKAVLEALRADPELGYDARDIFIDKDGTWHVNGLPFEPADAHHHMDVAFNALHGAYGEDGKVQSILEAHGMPFTGSGSLASAIGMNKILAKQVLTAHGVKSPYWKEIPSQDIQDDPVAAARDLFMTFLMPAVIKPASAGSSVGVAIVRKHADIAPALIEAARHGHAVLVEELIPGIETTCGVIEGFRGQELYALPPVEIRTHNGFFDYEAKYQGKSEEIVPATFPAKLKKEIEELAIKVHSLLGLRHYSRTDFIIHPRRGIYVLEANTLPGLTQESLVPKALRAVGSSLTELADHLVQLALAIDKR